jgi:hypothetical protein
MVKAGGTVENPARIKELRKTVARILTIEHEPKREPKKEPKPEKKKAKTKAKLKTTKEKKTK